jgi:MoaA/NifB/PqqE/SkfB family radical SAM enzyme
MKRIDYSKLYNAFLKIHSFVPSLLPGTGALSPLTVSLEVTHRCNLNCTMCFQFKNTENRTEMTPAEIKAFIDQVPGWALLTFTGGEPFVRKDFPEILEYGLKKHKCSLLTNATLVTEAHIPLLLKKNMTLIGVSIDGLEAVHDAIRKKPGAFRKAVDTIRAVVRGKKANKNSFPLIDIKTVILKENLAELSGILKLADELGADFLSLSLPKLSDRQFNEPYYENLERDILSQKPQRPEPLSKEEEETLKKQLSLIKGYKGRVKVRFYPYGMLDGELAADFFKNGLSGSDFYPCRLPWSLGVVSPYGELYPCLSYNAGNLKEKTLKELWNGPRLKALRSKLNKRQLDDFCLGCCYSARR